MGNSCLPKYKSWGHEGVDIVCMAGEWLTAAANANMFTYEVSKLNNSDHSHVFWEKSVTSIIF
jgi:hypothetical protein